jgi:hypothetical protein
MEKKTILSLVGGITIGVLMLGTGIGIGYAVHKTPTPTPVPSNASYFTAEITGGTSYLNHSDADTPVCIRVQEFNVDT